MNTNKSSRPPGARLCEWEAEHLDPAAIGKLFGPRRTNAIDPLQPTLFDPFEAGGRQ